MCVPPSPSNAFFVTEDLVTINLLYSDTAVKSKIGLAPEMNQRVTHVNILRCCRDSVLHRSPHRLTHYLDKRCKTGRHMLQNNTITCSKTRVEFPYNLRNFLCLFKCLQDSMHRHVETSNWSVRNHKFELTLCVYQDNCIQQDYYRSHIIQMLSRNKLGTRDEPHGYDMLTEFVKWN